MKAWLLLRHLGREIYFSIAPVFFALIMLFAFMDLIHELSVMGQGQYHLGYVLLFVVLTIPGHIYGLFPVAVLVGTILALVQMSASSELTVYRSSGTSAWQLVGALFKIALPLVLLSFLMSEVIAPPSERMAQQLRLKAQNAQASLREFRSGVWVKDERSFVNVKNVMPDTSLLNIDIYRFDETYHLQAITNAKRANFIEAGRWQRRGAGDALWQEVCPSIPSPGRSGLSVEPGYFQRAAGVARANVRHRFVPVCRTRKITARRVRAMKSRCGTNWFIPLPCW